jgi:hypothetical protein
MNQLHLDELAASAVQVMLEQLPVVLREDSSEGDELRAHLGLHWVYVRDDHARYLRGEPEPLP